jgi:2-succinyl-6-hydroxy-2,4-cyclohexadiene-1-carboxylate synthase
MTSTQSFSTIHGFLGQAEDWKSVIPSTAPQTHLELFHPELSKTPLSFDKIAEQIENEALRLPTPRILVGYSLGGRIALHALFRNPTLWSGAILISTHPGLQTQQEKEDRLRSDAAWAQRFLNDPWESVLPDWNRQTVLASTASPERSVSHFSRHRLAEALQNCSLGHQEDFRPRLAFTTVPIDWIVGARDSKFLALARSLPQNPLLRVRILDTGHRVIFEKASEILRS